MTRRANAQKMARLLARRQKHGWSWAELSRRSGEPVWKLQWWSRRLATGSPGPGRRGTFAPVRVVEPGAGSCFPIELLLPTGVRILVPVECDTEQLRRVILAASGAC